MCEAKALVLLAASRGSGKVWESLTSSLRASVTAAQAILCFPRSPWRRKGAGTSAWQRFLSGQAGKGVRSGGRCGLEPKGEVAEPISMARVLQVPLPAAGQGERTECMLGTAGRGYRPAPSSSWPQARWHLPGAGQRGAEEAARLQPHPGSAPASPQVLGPPPPR